MSANLIGGMALGEAQELLPTVPPILEQLIRTYLIQGAAARISRELVRNGFGIHSPCAAIRSSTSAQI